MATFQTQFVPRRPVAHDTGVHCPTCPEGELITRFTCLSVGFRCSCCGHDFTLESLVKTLDDEDFERLAETVQYRFSNRV